MPTFNSREDFEQAMRKEPAQQQMVLPEIENKTLPEDTDNITTDNRMPTHRVKRKAQLGRFQVARKAYSVQGKFAANITIGVNKIQFNAACIRFYPETNYVEILIDPERKMLAIRPCNEYAKGAYQWARNQKKDHKRVSRQISMTEAWSLFFTMMGWDPNNKYKIDGTRKIFDDADIVLFLIEEAIEYTTEKELQPDGTYKTKRNAFLPAQWRNNFGDYVDVHDQKMKIAAEETLRLFNTPDGTAHLLQPKTKT